MWENKAQGALNTLYGGDGHVDARTLEVLFSCLTGHSASDLHEYLVEQGLGDVERLTADQWMRQVVCVPVPERMVRESASGPSLATSTSCVSVPNSAEGSEDEEQEDV